MSWFKTRSRCFQFPTWKGEKKPFKAFISLANSWSVFKYFQMFSSSFQAFQVYQEFSVRQASWKHLEKTSSAISSNKVLWFQVQNCVNGLWCQVGSSNTVVNRISTMPSNNDNLRHWHCSRKTLLYPIHPHINAIKNNTDALNAYSTECKHNGKHQYLKS